VGLPVLIPSGLEVDDGNSEVAVYGGGKRVTSNERKRVSLGWHRRIAVFAGRFFRPIVMSLSVDLIGGGMADMPNFLSRIQLFLASV
jgi:hypothetical protein